MAIFKDLLLISVNGIHMSNIQKSHPIIMIRILSLHVLRGTCNPQSLKLITVEFFQQLKTIDILYKIFNLCF